MEQKFTNNRRIATKLLSKDNEAMTVSYDVSFNCNTFIVSDMKKKKIHVCRHTTVSLNQRGIVPIALDEKGCLTIKHMSVNGNIFVGC